MSTAIKKSLIKETIDFHEKALQAAQDAFNFACSAGQNLMMIKDNLKHGEFTGFVEKNFPFSVRSAQVYIKLHQNRAMLPAGEKLSINQALKLISTSSEAPGATQSVEPVQMVEIEFTRAENQLLKTLLDAGLSEKKAHQFVFQKAEKRLEKQNQKLLPAPASSSAPARLKRKEKSVVNQFSQIAELDQKEARKLLKELTQLLKQQQHQNI